MKFGYQTVNTKVTESMRVFHQVCGFYSISQTLEDAHKTVQEGACELKRNVFHITAVWMLYLAHEVWMLNPRYGYYTSNLSGMDVIPKVWMLYQRYGYDMRGIDVIPKVRMLYLRSEEWMLYLIFGVWMLYFKNSKKKVLGCKFTR